MHIRPATLADAEAITRIYGHHVLHGTGTFEEVPPNTQNMILRISKVIDAGWPWLVAEDEGGEVLGYAYAAQFRDRVAYRYCCEDSIYIAPEAQSRGVGALLLQELINSARQYGFTTIMAIIGDSANAGSVGVHRKFGFSHVGTMRAVGFKFDRWLDVVTMQLSLTE